MGYREGFFFVTKLEQVSAKVPKLVAAETERAVRVAWRPIRWTTSQLQASHSVTLLFLERVEIVVFAFVLILLRDRYTDGSEQVSVLLGP